MTKAIGFLTAVLMMGSVGLTTFGFVGTAHADVDTLAKQKATGIGVSIETKDGKHLINLLIPGAPAEKSGKIALNDEIVAVKSTPAAQWVVVTGKTIEELSPLIRGDVGTQVGLRFKRGATTFEVTLTRAEFEFDDGQP